MGSNGPNGWVFDNGAVLWVRQDQSTFQQVATGDLSPNSIDFYSDQPGIFAGSVVVGNIGVPPGSSQQSYVMASSGNPITVNPFPSVPFAPGMTFMRFWADERQLAFMSPGLLAGFFMAQLRDALNVDHLYTSQNMVLWTPLVVSATV
jgi:hypothetical protein